MTETTFENGKLIVTRTFDAPRALVFEAWVETSKVEAWWGCDQTTAVRSEIEPRVGGKYNHDMTIDGKHEHPAHAVLTAFDPPEHLAYESAMPGSPVPMTVDVRFTEVDGGTQIVLTHAGIPDMEVDGGHKMCDIVSGGWTAAFRKLDAFLSAGAPS